MRIGIFGGSFNPPHKMHLRIAEELIEHGFVDNVIFVPTGNKYKYKNNLISDKDRLEMLRIMTRKDSNLKVSDYELKDEVIYTYDTLNYFRKTYPNDEIYFICGADNLSYIDEWKNGYWILSNIKILVIRRSTNDLDKILDRFNEYKENIIVTDITSSDISSTSIREYLRKDENIRDLLDEEVILYIKENNLYADSVS